MGVKKRVVTDETGREILNQLKIMNYKAGKRYLYGFEIKETESDPKYRVTYLNDAIGLEPAKMDYSKGVFDYGGWKDAFFMPRPCMVKSDGTVDYYLDPEDYSKKEDGVTASDYNSTSYDGNAMMEWGQNGNKIWYKADAVNNRFYVSNQQVDDYYHAWSFVNNQGELVDHFYTAIYNGSKDENNKMRSISGLAPTKSLNTTQQITAAELNNTSLTDKLWYIDTFADRILINILLTLMARSTDHQTAFGKGVETGSEAAVTNYLSGALDDKGMFFGYNDETHAVKVFGMENWYGLQWRRTAGLCIQNGVLKYKLTYGVQDGSAATAYNQTGTDYIATDITPSGTSGGYISKMTPTSKGAWLPDTASGSSATYYCDGLWFNNGANTYALFGGGSSYGAAGGSFCCLLSAAASYASWNTGCALSLKPLA